MTFDEFLGSLDAENPYTPCVGRNLRALNIHEDMRAARKGRDLLKVVRGFCAEQAYPVIDKKLGMVLGVGYPFHRMMCAVLHHYHLGNSRHAFVSLACIKDAAATYIASGGGYFISALRPTVIVLGNTYCADGLDEELFHAFEVERVR